MDCARAIIQSGIKEVVIDGKWNDDNSEKWREQARRSSEMVGEVGVKVRVYNGSFIELSKFHHGEKGPLR